VVFGAGGAAYAVVYGLLKSGISQIYLVNRTKANATRLIKKMAKVGSKIKYISTGDDLLLQIAVQKSKWVINTTSLGMGKLKKLSPLSKNIKLHRIHCVLDLIYHPAQTLFLKQAQKAGAKTGNGLWMLIFQGALAFQKFLNRRPNILVMAKALKNKIK
jgi:shikimate dehydrogenase